MVDTLGLILAAVVHAADIQDRDGGRLTLERMRDRYPRLQLIWADSGYAGQFVEWALLAFTWIIEIVKKPSEGFSIVAHRWIVERTFGWLSHYRRLSKDYEHRPESSEARILIAMINLMVHRLEPEIIYRKGLFTQALRPIFYSCCPKQGDSVV